MRNCSLSVSIGLLFFALVNIAGATKRQDNTNNGEIRVESKSIPPQVTYQFSREVGRGRLVKAKDGKPGTVKRTYRIILHDGKAVGKELIKEERSEATNTLYLMGREGYQTSRGSWARSKVLDMVATAYTDSPAENGGSTRAANGMGLEYGIVAVDPRVIPIGTKLYVEGYGFAYAADTGGAIKGNRIDLCLPSYGACNNWGRRRVKVHVLSGRD
jgi:3D (Asp-Asp-Asp) domain-containing protein